METKIIKKEENINGIKGYKIFGLYWMCRDKHYTCPGTFKEKGKLEICGHGMHFCQTVADCFNYYDFNFSFNTKYHIAEVIAWGNVITEGDKSCTDELEIIRELTKEEILKLVNFGINCTGLKNTGDFNSGSFNTGNHNVGDSNVGAGNRGYCNIGNFNVTGMYLQTEKSEQTPQEWWNDLSDNKKNIIKAIPNFNPQIF